MNTQMYLEVQRLLNLFWRSLDRREYQELLGYVTENCSWTRGETMRGKEEIWAALQVRSPQLTTRHLVSDLIVNTSDGHTFAEYRLVAFAHIAKNEGENPPFPSALPVVIADIQTKIEQNGEVLKIASIDPVVIFQRTPD